MLFLFSVLEVNKFKKKNNMPKHIIKHMHDKALIHHEYIKTVEIHTYKKNMRAELLQENFDKVDNYTQKGGDDVDVKIKAELSFNQKCWESYH